MNREITDIYKKNFFLDFGKQISQTRQRQGLDIDDVSEMTGMSKIKIKSIEKGYALDKKPVITLLDMPAEKDIDKLLPA